LRLMECVRLRVKDVDFGMNQIVVHDGKGMKDRTTMLPETVQPSLDEHLTRVRALHERDLANGYGSVFLPHGLERKYPNAKRKWGWQYVFPAKSLSKDPRSGQTRRHHIHQNSLQRAVKAVADLINMDKHITCHTFRHTPFRRGLRHPNRTGALGP